MSAHKLIRRLAVVLPLLVAATALPVATPGRGPQVRHWAMSVDSSSVVQAPDDFSLVGVKVPSGAQSPAGARVRASLDGKRWSEWLDVEFDTDVGPDRNSDEAGAHTSMPIWTGPSRFVDVRFDGATPRGASVHAIDPGPDPSQPASSAMASPSRPGIVTRAEWGADESIRRDKPDYAEPLRMAIIHHTATADSYSKGESDNIVRSIYAYHVNTNGWDDIGYNFLVDRYGQIFEGRYGGIDRTVIGAHAQGFNSHSTGISVIGNFASSKPPDAAMNSLKRILSWRLDRGTVDPTGALTYVSNGSNKYAEGTKVKLKTVSAHRDVGKTACPGNPLYNALGWMRSAARKDGSPKLFKAKASRAAITPNRDGVADSLKLTGTFSSKLGWKVQVQDSNGKPVWKVSGYGSSLGVNWYGKDSSGNYVRHNNYRFRVTGKTSSGSLRNYYVPFSVYRWPAGTFFLAQPSDRTYIMQGKGTLRRPSHWHARGTRYRSSERVEISDSVMKYYPKGSDIGFRDGAVVKADGKLYAISDGKRRPTSTSALTTLGYNTDAIIDTTTEALAPHALGATLGSSNSYPNGAALFSSTGSEAWVLGGVARPFMNDKVRGSHVIRDVDLVGPADAEVADGATSARVGFRDGTLLRLSGAETIYIVSGGKRRAFQSASTFSRMGFAAANIVTVTVDELALHPEGKPV